MTGVEVELRDGRETIATDIVVNAGGMFAPEIGRMAGVTIPIIPMAHQYLFTEAIEGVIPALPQLRDPDNLVYFREEVGGLCMGGYERNPAPWSLDGVPADFNGKLLAPDWPRFEEIMAGAVRRVPAIADAGVTRMINGPEGFTPDNEFILGETDVRGFFVAAGFCAHGIAGAGGIGRQMASGSSTASRSWTSGRWTSGDSAPSTGARHSRSPGRPRSTRPTTTSTTRTRSARRAARSGSRRRIRVLAELGAVFGEKSGWERPNWFEPNETTRQLEALRPRGWAGQHWSTGDRSRGPRHAASGRAVRRELVREDRGRGTRRLLPSSSGSVRNDVDVAVGRIVYTADAEPPRRDRDRPDGHPACPRPVPDRDRERPSGNHDLGWIRKHLPDDGSVEVRDITSARACFGLWGPRARDILVGL